MKRTISITVLLTACLLSAPAFAERLELGLAMTPTWVHDGAYEAFSSDNLHAGRFGLDLRTEVASINGFKLVPFFGYRFSLDTGYIYSELDTTLKAHDFMLGLRVRKGLLPWIAVFGELGAGVLFTAMDGSLNEPSVYGYSDEYGGVASDLAPLQFYEDRAVTWSVAVLLGAEVTFSRAWLRSRGIQRFCFGGEVSGGYIRRGDIALDPTLESGGDNALAAESVGSWGAFNPSGGMIQFAFNFYFF